MENPDIWLCCSITSYLLSFFYCLCCLQMQSQLYGFITLSPQIHILLQLRKITCSTKKLTLRITTFLKLLLL